MNTVKVKAYQTMADIAIQEYGMLEAVCDIARSNQLGITETLVDGMLLVLPDVSYNKKMKEHCKINNISPATEPDRNLWGIFTEEFTQEFN